MNTGLNSRIRANAGNRHLLVTKGSARAARAERRMVSNERRAWKGL